MDGLMDCSGWRWAACGAGWGGPRTHQRGCCIVWKTHFASRMSGLLMLWISDTISIDQGRAQWDRGVAGSSRDLLCSHGSQTSSLESQLVQPLPPREAPTVNS